MRVMLIHNPTAGSARHSKQALVSSLHRPDISVEYCSTKQHSIDEAMRRPADLIVIAGGDGTVAKVLVRTTQHSPPVAIVPTGTANNIARSMGVTDVPVALSELLRWTQFRRFNLGSARGPWGERRFVEAVGFGPLARALDAAHKSKHRQADEAARLRNGRRALQDFVRDAEPMAIGISIDGNEPAGELIALEILNVAYTGPALPLAPGAEAGDGKLDVVCLPVERRKEMIAWLEAPHRTPPPVLARQAHNVSITGDLPHQRVDDELFHPADRATIIVELERKAAKVVLPPDV